MSEPTRIKTTERAIRELHAAQVRVDGAQSLLQAVAAGLLAAYDCDPDAVLVGTDEDEDGPVLIVNHANNQVPQ